MACSVLVVDDDASFRHLAARIVSSWGHVVIGEAATVAEALARVAELRPDTVLADMALISSDPDAASDAVARQVGASGFVRQDDLPDALSRKLIEGG